MMTAKGNTVREVNLRCYDNGGQTVDRYTILPSRHAHAYRERNGLWVALAASAEPFHPQGFGQHTAAAPGRHLGKRIAFTSLPPDVQRFARQSFVGVAP